jgi:hypothetical protein
MLRSIFVASTELWGSIASLREVKGESHDPKQYARGQHDPPSHREAERPAVVAPVAAGSVGRSPQRRSDHDKYQERDHLLVGSIQVF